MARSTSSPSPNGSGNTQQYTGQNIKVLKDLEPVRVRPAMYIGGVDSRGLHHLIWEILDNSIDEYLGGHADNIDVILHPDGRTITIEDNGRGIPVDQHPEYKKSTLEVILTTLHAGGKFDSDNYVFSGGLHGVGASVVNALAKELIVTVKRDGQRYQQHYSMGIPTSKVKKIGPARGTGTIVTFTPDQTIFPRTQFVSETIRTHLEDVSYIHSGLTLVFDDQVHKQKQTLHNPGGLVDFLKKQISDSQKKLVVDAMFHLDRNDDEKMELALQWTEATDESIRSYVNGIRTPGGGTHESGLKTAVVKAIRGFLETHKARIPLKGVTITPDDIREGLVAILSVFHRDPQFQGQTKDKLNNPEMANLVDSWVKSALENWLNNNPSLADAIVGRIVLAARARAASREAAQQVKRKGPTSRRLNLPGKLVDCSSSTKPEESEIFIVEGQSAGGTAKQGRNSVFQAVLPVQGKIKNTEGLNEVSVLKHSEIKDLVLALGTDIGKQFNMANLRYGKIILLMDADVDGHHISTLMLTFFYRHMPELIRSGKLFIARPPLYRIKVGKENIWAHDDAHKEEVLAGLKKNAKYEISRFKGLGEMAANVLRDTTLDPAHRTLLKVSIDSELDADGTFASLLGKDPSLRYQFIMDYAGLADELDI